MRLELSKCYFSYNFHWSPAKLCENIGYHGESKCLLEYCNGKLASSPIYYLKHSCVLGLQFKHRVKAPGPIVQFHLKLFKFLPDLFLPLCYLNNLEEVQVGDFVNGYLPWLDFCLFPKTF